jgi:hypothetical protein
LFEIAAGGDHLPMIARASAGSLYALAHPFPRIDGLPMPDHAPEGDDFDKRPLRIIFGSN